IVYGRSRLAVQVDAGPEGPGCEYCGRCLRGCPRQLIYNSASTVRTGLKPAPGFVYRPGVLIQRLVEHPDKVSIMARNLETGEPCSFEAKRVFVACGLRATTRLVLHALDAWDEPVRIRDAGHFTLPLLSRTPAKGVEAESLHTLAQLFLEIMDPAVSPHLVHLQLYTYNDMFPELLRKKLGPLARLGRPLMERLVVAFGYLHSNDSDSIEARLRNAPPRFILSRKKNARAREVMNKAIRKVKRHARDMNLIPLPAGPGTSSPGRFFHCAGSLPMRKDPGRLESDTLGRPSGCQRIHAVDASVLPTAPATTITMTIMANAHRIGSLAPDE
ncbi:MAG: GMC oxidoreductase, partial [Verrucomicrobiota bacterium]